MRDPNCTYTHCFCRLDWHYPILVDKLFDPEGQITCCKCLVRKVGEVTVDTLVDGEWVSADN